jgi:hypothetical protein
MSYIAELWLRPFMMTLAVWNAASTAWLGRH